MAPPSPPPSRPPSWPGRHWTLVKVSFRVALILMTLSLFACREVASPAEMADVRLGLPIPFVSVDARDLPPAAFPRCVHLGDPKRRSVRLRPLAALADLGLLMTLLVVATLAWRRIARTGRG